VLGSTVVRTHARFSVTWPESGIFPVDAALIVGIVAQNTTFAASELIGPAAQGEDWAYLDGFLPGTGCNSYVPSPDVVTGNHPEGFLLDLRAKRKVQELGQSWILATQARQLNVGESVSVAWFVRSLVALP